MSYLGVCITCHLRVVLSFIECLVILIRAPLLQERAHLAWQADLSTASQMSKTTDAFPSTTACLASSETIEVSLKGIASFFIVQDPF